MKQKLAFLTGLMFTTAHAARGVENDLGIDAYTSTRFSLTCSSKITLINFDLTFEDLSRFFL